MGTDDVIKQQHHHHHHHHHHHQQQQQQQPIVRFCYPHIKCKEKYYTVNKKRDKHQAAKEKYATEPKDKYRVQTDSGNSGTGEKNSRPDKKAQMVVSQVAQIDYMKRHLYIKSGVDRAQTAIVKYQVKKVSFRNYTPKAIDQEINMGMWI